MVALDKIRNSVIIALEDGHYTQAGILQVQLQQMEMGSTDRFNEKPIRRIVIDGFAFETPAECVRYYEGKKFKRSSAPITEEDFITSSWRRAILRLPEPMNYWINYAYGRDINYECQKSICLYIWDEFLTQHKRAGFKEMKEKTVATMRRLTFYCIQHVRRDSITKNDSIEESQSKKEFAEDRLLSALLNMSVELWRKDYKKRWKIMKQACESLDQLSLLSASEIRHEKFSCNRN